MTNKFSRLVSILKLADVRLPGDNFKQALAVMNGKSTTMPTDSNAKLAIELDKAIPKHIDNTIYTINGVETKRFGDVVRAVFAKEIAIEDIAIQLP